MGINEDSYIDSKAFLIDCMQGMMMGWFDYLLNYFICLKLLDHQTFYNCNEKWLY